MFFALDLDALLYRQSLDSPTSATIFLMLQVAGMVVPTSAWPDVPKPFQPIREDRRP
jgi:hypothetical protein